MIQLEDHGNVDAVVLAYRRDGELFELAEVEPPVSACIESLD
jgi:hypothetical protein